MADYASLLGTNYDPRAEGYDMISAAEYQAMLNDPSRQFMWQADPSGVRPDWAVGSGYMTDPGSLGMNTADMSPGGAPQVMGYYAPGVAWGDNRGSSPYVRGTDGNYYVGRNPVNNSARNGLLGAAAVMGGGALLGAGMAGAAGTGLFAGGAPAAGLGGAELGSTAAGAAMAGGGAGVAGPAAGLPAGLGGAGAATGAAGAAGAGLLGSNIPGWVAPAAGLLATGIQANAAENAAAQTAQQQRDAAAQAAEMARFRPYGVTNSFGSSSFDTVNDRATYTASPQVAGIRDSLMNASQAEYGRLLTDPNSSPLAMQRALFDQYAAATADKEMNQFNTLQERMAGQGLLEMRVNGGAAGTNQNPFMSDFAEGIRRADLDASRGAFMDAQKLRDLELGRARGMWTDAAGIDALAAGTLDAGAALGGRATQAGQAGATLMNAGAQAAARTQAAGNQAQQDAINAAIANALGTFNQSNQQLPAPRRTTLFGN